MDNNTENIKANNNSPEGKTSNMVNHGAEDSTADARRRGTAVNPDARRRGTAANPDVRRRGTAANPDARRRGTAARTNARRTGASNENANVEKDGVVETHANADEAVKTYTEEKENRVKKPKKKRRLLWTVLLCFVSACCLVGLGIAIGMDIGVNKPIPVYAQTRGLELGTGPYISAIDDNYWRFVDMSYINVGTRENCQLYKIVSEVARNDYDEANFYAETDGGFKYYHDADGNRISRIAVDVSSHNESIDWTSLKNEGVSVAMIRVGFRGYGNGDIKTDDNFETNIQGALNAGMEVGVYFFTQAMNADEGVEEANYVLNLIKDYNVSCPVTVDTEFVSDESARTYNLDITSRTDAVVAFCDTVKAAGYEPMIYSNRNWFVQNLDMTRLGGYKLWVAHYVDTVDFPYNFNAWQYTEEGNLAGCGNSIDLDVWFD